MERVIKWFVHNSVAANMFMFFILIAGFLTIPRIKMEVFPDISIDVISVSVIYPGASPKDVEDGICVRIEEKVQGLRGIKKISSTYVEISLLIFPRAFLTVYIILLYYTVVWFMDLPDPTFEQSGLISVIVGAGAAWFGLYAGTSGSSKSFKGEDKG